MKKYEAAAGRVAAEGLQAWRWWTEGEPQWDLRRDRDSTGSELFNFNLDNDKKLHRKSLASSSSWEKSAKHSVLWSAVTERRLVSLSRAAERDVRALRLEDELNRLLAKGSRSETDIAIEVGGTHTAEDSKGSVLGLKSPVLSLRELQSLLKSGEELLSSYAVDGKTKSPARLRPFGCGGGTTRCRCALDEVGCAKV